jgi:hypothetical protein
MLKLLFPPNLRILPSAKCPKHASTNIEPVSTRIPGKVTVVWVCPLCASEREQEIQMPCLDLNAKRRIMIED